MRRAHAGSIAMSAAALLVSCTLHGLPPLELHGVEPQRVSNAAAAELLITGDGFWPAAADLDDADGSGEETAFLATLHGSNGEVVLQDVVREDRHALRAVLEAGVPPGRWSLRVVDPRGRDAYLPDALEVLSDCTATVVEPANAQVDAASIDSSRSSQVGEGTLQVSRDDDVERRALLYFDIGAIPSGSVVTKAKLKLHRDSGETVAVTVLAHELSRSWAPAEVTWTEAAAGDPWVVPGGDHSEKVSGLATVTSQSTAWDVTDSVAAWVSGARPNHGHLLRVAPFATGGGISFAVTMDESAPKVTIDYCLP